jgi:SAM-dependent methyltransferase
MLFWKLYSSDFRKLDEQFEEMQKTLEQNKINLKGKTCLEIGPGNSYINAYNFLMNGAERVILVDKFPRYIKTSKQKIFFNDELQYVMTKYKKKLFFIRNNKLKPRYIKLIIGDLTNVEIKDKVDFCYSVSVLEHVKDLELNIKKLSQLIRKGGVMYHSIDLRDHYNFNNPFLFYKYSEKTLDKYLTKEGISYANRKRCDEYLYLFKKYGFKILSREVKRFQIDIKNVNSNFKKQKNLNAGILRLLLKNQKPEASK